MLTAQRDPSTCGGTVRGALCQRRPDASLDRWASRIRGWADAGLDVFVSFDNDIKVHAPYDALRLAERLGV